MATQASGYWCWDGVPDVTNKTPGSGDPFGGGMGGGIRGGAEGVRGEWYLIPRNSEMEVQVTRMVATRPTAALRD